MIKKIASKYYLFFIISFLSCFFSLKLPRIEENYFFRVLSVNLKSIKYSNCDINLTKKLTPDSIVIVGHAYGSSSTESNNFISPKLEKFLEKNKKNIMILFLTGDVFEKPNKEKWEKLFNKYKEHFEIHIAPGNHDINSNEIIFSLNEKLINLRIRKYPYLKKIKNYNFVVEDSYSKGWQIDNEVSALVNKFEDTEQNFILRHNIVNKEFLNLANSKEGLISDLPSIKNLTQKFKKKVTIISGDTGASKDLPSYFCKKQKNVTVIINGIGNLDKDNILIIQNKEIYRYDF